MTTQEMYEKKRAYIEGNFTNVLKAFPGFEDVRYVIDSLTGEEYLRIKDEANGPAFINVTGNSDSANAREISRVLLGQKPLGLVSNSEVKRAIAPLFRKEAM